MADSLHVSSTSRQSAVADPITIRLKDTRRLIVLPEIVDNPNDKKACVKGTFVYQRKSKKDTWEDEQTFDLNQLKNGEGAKWHLSSAELLHFLREVADLYRIYLKEGKVPLGESEYIKVTDPLKELIQLGEAGLTPLLGSKPEDAKKLVEGVLAWINTQGSNQDLLDSLAGLQQFSSAELNTVVRLASLRKLIAIWNQNSTNDDEEFWQRELTACPYAFSLVFPYAVVVVKEKAYLGGKDITNTGGNLADFLVKRALTGNCLVVEIKTPKTALLGPKYRDNAFSISKDLSGATIQTQNYLQSLVAEANQLLPQSSGAYALHPRGLVLAGNSSELDDAVKQKSFELYRNSLERLEILTYDEFYHKAEMLVDLLRQDGS